MRIYVESNFMKVFVDFEILRICFSLPLKTKLAA